MNGDPEPARRDLVMTPVAIDPRDQGEDHDPATVVGKHGDTYNCVTLHVPGVTKREQVEAEIHQVIEATPRPDSRGPLCGVHHVEDVGIWQTAHTGRAELRKVIADLGAQYRRPVVIVHGYQHVGPCVPGEAS